MRGPGAARTDGPAMAIGHTRKYDGCHRQGAESHLALVGLLEPLAKPDQAALLQRSQVAQVPLNVVCVQFVCNRSDRKPLTTENTGTRRIPRSCSVKTKDGPRAVDLSDSAGTAD